MRVTLNLLTLILIFVCLSGAASAGTSVGTPTYYTGTLNSAQEVPTNSSTAVGFGRVTLNSAETQITVSLTFSGLSSNQTASHIHGPAPVGANAPILFNIGSTGATSGTFTALTFAVTPAQVADLKRGLWYFNVHSTNFTGGEIRGQITVDSPFVAYLNSNQEVPSNVSAATGRGAVSLNATGTQIVSTLSFGGLGSNQVASHIHGASSPGVNAPILFNIGSTGATSGTFTDLFFNVTPVQVAQLKSGQFYFNVHSATFPGGEIRGQILRRRSTVLDFDGDAKTDYAVVRNDMAGGVINWYILNSATGGITGRQFGASGDFAQNRVMAGDFDGDGKDDITVWRTGALAYFYILQSGTNTFRAEQFGTTGDDPRMINDYDGDGRTDVAVWRSAAPAVLYYRPSANNPGGNFIGQPWGTTGDFPNPGDYDGDGRGDICVQRGGVFYCLNSTTGFKSFNWGTSSDFVAPGDYDGDGKTDVAVVRTVSGSRNWYPFFSLTNSGNNPATGSSGLIVWGTSLAARTQGDYNGDGKTDVAVWQSIGGSQRAYYVLLNNNPLSPVYTQTQWGLDTDISVNAYNVR